MHFGSPSDPSETTAAKAKPRYVYSISKPHGHSSRSQVRPLLREVKPSYVYSILKPHGQSFRRQVRLLHLNHYFDFQVCLSFLRLSVCLKTISISYIVSQNDNNKSCLVCVQSKKYASWVTLRPKSDCCHRGKAKVHITNFKTTWSEFQRPSQTPTKRGKAELRIFDFKTTWSEFQRPSPTTTERGKAKLRILNFKTTWSDFQTPNQTAGSITLFYFSFSSPL